MSDDLPWGTLTETHDYRTGKTEIGWVTCPECGSSVRLFDRQEDDREVVAAHRIGSVFCKGSRLILIGVTLSQCQAKLDEILEMLEGE